MGDQDNNKFYNQKSEINIALASLMRLHDILNRIVSLDANYPVDSPEKQKSYLNLVKQYLISAVPYISVTDANKYKKEILGLSVKRVSNVSKGTQRFTYQFDPSLDARLNEILIELQIKLRRVFTKIKDEDDDGL